MIDTLKFVLGSVATKDWGHNLTNFLIRDGKIKGFNGVIGICAPISIDFEAAPKAVDFVKAVSACEEIISLHLDKGSRLVVKSGSFRSSIPCVDTRSYPDFNSEETPIKLDVDLKEVFKVLLPVVNENAYQEYSKGLYFHNGSVFVTDNRVFLQYWIGTKFPYSFNLPAQAAKEILRIKDSPTAIEISSRRVIFHYSGNRWLSAQTITAAWPDTNRLFETKPRLFPLYPRFFENLKKLAPFCDQDRRVYFYGDCMTTGLDKHAYTTIWEASPVTGIYNVDYLLKLSECVTHFAFQEYPNPVLGQGQKVRAVIMGMRQ